MMLHISTPWATRSHPMFSILRFIIIVGVIFYYSPVRQHGEGIGFLDSFLKPKKSESAATAQAPAPEPEPAAENPGRLEAVWQALPDSAKQAVIDRILTTSGLTSAGVKPGDTLQPQDRLPE
jgi:hypothetical protein